MDTSASTSFSNDKQAFDDQKGTLLITALDLSVLYVNKQNKETTGFSVAETVGKDHGKLWGGKWVLLFISIFGRSLR